MASYWGLKAIAQRLEVAPATVYVWHRTQGLLLYRRQRNKRSYWVTTDALLTLWERERCLRDLRIAQEKSRRRHAKA